MTRRQEGMAPHRVSRSPGAWVEVPPEPGDAFGFAFMYRAGPERIPAVTAYAVFERNPVPGTPSKIKSRLPQGTFDVARRRADDLVVRNTAWWEHTDMDPVPDALAESVPSGFDVTEQAIGLIRSQRPPTKDDLHYARCAAKYAVALRAGKRDDAAYRAVVPPKASLSTAKTDIAEADRRGFGRAARDILDAGEEPTPDAVLRAARLREHQLALRWLQHRTGGCGDRQAVKHTAEREGTTVRAIYDDAANAARDGRAEQLSEPSTDQAQEIIDAIQRVTIAEQHTEEAVGKAANAGDGCDSEMS